MKTPEDFLQHWGIKGMKWGVRRRGDGSIAPRATLGLIDRLDQQSATKNDGENVSTFQSRAYNEVYSHAASKIRKGVRALNKSPEFKDQDFRRDSPLRQKYYSAYSKMVTDTLNSTVGKSEWYAPFSKVGTTFFRKFEIHFEFDVNKQLRPSATIRRTDTRAAQKVKHSDESLAIDNDIQVQLVIDAKGYITDLIFPKEGLAQAMQAEIDDYLQHWGILGMHWGVRRGDNAGSKGGIFKKKVKAPEEPVVIVGKQTPTGRAPANHLSDQELKDRIARITLEGQYAKLTETGMHKARAAVSSMIMKSVTSAASDQLSKYLKDALIPELLKRLSKSNISSTAESARKSFASSPYS